MHLPLPGTFASRTIENSGHTPLFLIGTLLLIGILRHDFRLEGGRLYAIAGVLGTGAGLLSEVIQKPLRRDASWEDVFADAVGVICALALHAALDRRNALRAPGRGALLVVFAVGICIFLMPIVNMTLAYMHRSKHFPVIATFDSPIQQLWVVGYGVNREVRDGALEVRFVSKRFPGIAFFEPVADWSRFQTLVIDVENPEDEVLNLGLHIYDEGRHRGRRYADRFNRSFQLAAGERRVIRVPLEDIRRGPKDRLMNMTRISNVTLLRSEPGGSQRFRLHQVRLE